MGHLARLVEILAKIRDTTSCQLIFMGHIKKYKKGNRTECTLGVILLNITRISPKNKGHLRDTTSQNPKGQD